MATQTDPIPPYVMGVDLGSNTAKSVVLDSRGELVAHSVVQMGAVSKGGVRASIAQTLEQAGLTREHIARTIATGYGRRMVEMADRTFTEITCHARGAARMMPGVRMVIDIGGQDSKVIAVDANGFVEHFAMNDRCAGGTGKFFEVLAKAVEVELDEIGPLALRGSTEAQISSMCATFAETEVISMLAEDRPKEDILAAVHNAVAKRTVGLVNRVGIRTPIVMTGGVAKNPAAVRFLERALDVEIHLPAEPQIAGALGAALLALDDLRAMQRASAERSSAGPDGDAAGDAAVAGLADLEADLLDRQIRPDPAHGPACAHCRGAGSFVPLSIAPIDPR
jgi:CoA-substrate-specific enzyme activase, putative